MNKKILIIEDEPDIRDAIRDAVLEAGYEVETTTNGQEGLDKALEWQPDLLLVDLIMPIMGGKEMLEKLRQDPWGRNAKVVILTAMDDVANVATTHEYKISDYIIKTHASLTEVLNKIRLVLHSK